MTEKQGIPLGPPPPEVVQAGTQVPPPQQYFTQSIGEYQTSIKVPGQEFPPLAYIDIMPRCINAGNIAIKVVPQFEKFSSIIDSANIWLEANAGLMVWKCETIERVLDKAPGGGFSYQLETMINRDSTYGYVIRIRGLRMWLTKRQGTGPLQKIGFIGLAPDSQEVAIPSDITTTKIGYKKTEGIFFAHDTRFYAESKLQTRVGLEKTFEKLNKMLKDKPLPGTVLNVDLAKVEVYDGNDYPLDPESTCWAEDKQKEKRWTLIIKVFYIQGTPAHEEIGMQTFLPGITALPDMMKTARYQTMTEVTAQMALWLRSQQGIRVVNVQQIDCRVYTMDEVTEIDYDSTDEVELKSNFERHMIRTIRLFFTRGPQAPPPPPFLTPRIFHPIRTSERSYESMTQTMDRIVAWLKLTGLPVFSVETVPLMFTSSTQGQGVNLDRSDYKLIKHAANSWVTCIRVYFANTFVEPHPTQLPIPLDWTSQIDTSGGFSKTCVLL